MAFDLGSIIGSGIGDSVAKIIGLFKVDPNLALQQTEAIEKMKSDLQNKLVDQITAQIDVDKQEAANANLFVSGWRPFIGWVCGAGLLCQYLIGPIFTWINAIYSTHPTPFPPLDLGTLLTLLLGMLGLGGLRSYEKVNGAVGADKLQ